jgi:hypothetical protein
MGEDAQLEAHPVVDLVVFQGDVVLVSVVNDERATMKIEANGTGRTPHATRAKLCFLVDDSDNRDEDNAVPGTFRFLHLSLILTRCTTFGS